MHKATKNFFLLLFLLIMGCCAAAADEPPRAPGFILPDSARVGLARDETGEPPVLIDRITCPDAWQAVQPDPDKTLFHIWFPQILNTDAMLLQCDNETILVDCSSAKQASRIIALLNDLGIRKVDRLINTHPHYDHLQGLESLAEVVEIGEMLICFPEDENQHMKKAVAICTEKNIPIVHYGDGDRFFLNGAVLDVWLKGDPNWSLNEASAQIRVQYGERTALLTADMMLKTQERLIATVDPELLDIDLLKYPHHGLNALHEDFLNATSPLMAVITNNGKTWRSHYCLNLAGIPSCSTVPGYIHCVTDGTYWFVERVEPGTDVT